MPSLIVQEEMSKIDIQCFSIGKTYWSKVDGAIPLQSNTAGGFRLKLYNVSSMDSGRYYCNGKKQGGEMFSAHADVFIGGRLFFPVIVSIWLAFLPSINLSNYYSDKNVNTLLLFFLWFRSHCLYIQIFSQL